MRSLKTSEAAALLNVSSSTLRAWELRFGFPTAALAGRTSGIRPCRSGSAPIGLGGRRFDLLGSNARSCLGGRRQQFAGSCAVRVRSRLADRAIETALAFRSVERSVEEVLLPSLEEVIGRNGLESAAWAFSARWAADWLQRAMCLRGTFPSRTAVVLGDGSSGELDIDGLYIRALELFCRRAGLKVLRLSTRAVSGVGDVLSVHRPELVVLAGSQANDDTVARWAGLITRSIGPIPVGLYRRPTGAGGNTVLPPAPGEAQMRLMELVDPSAPVRELRSRDRLRPRPAPLSGEPARCAIGC